MARDCTDAFSTLLDQIERGDHTARLDPAAGTPEMIRRLNGLLDMLEEASGWHEVYPREISLVQQRYEELLRVLSAIRRLSDVLSEANTPEEVCSSASVVLAAELEFECCHIYLYDRRRDELREAGSTCGRHPAVYSASNGPLADAFRSQYPTLTYPKPDEDQRGFVALAPMRADEERLGIIKLGSPLAELPSRHIEHALVLLSATAAQMLKSVELKRRLDALNQGLGLEVERFMRRALVQQQEIRRISAVVEELVDCNTSPILIFGQTGRLLKLNAAAAAIWGRPARDLVGHRFSALLPKETRRLVVAEILRDLRQRHWREHKIAIRAVSGRVVKLTVSLRPAGGDQEDGPLPGRGEGRPPQAATPPEGRRRQPAYQEAAHYRRRDFAAREP
ncbi:MAG: PAS domain S-box protein [Pseudomonadota bacterium]